MIYVKKLISYLLNLLILIRLIKTYKPPSIANTSAIILLAEIPDINTFNNVKQLAAYADLSPSQKFSGSSVKGKI